MNEQVLSAVRSLPRQKLEDLAIHAVTEVRNGRREHGPNKYFNAVLTGFLLGTLIATSGFVVGAALR